MKSAATLLLGILLLPGVALAQDHAAEIDRALAAAPGRARADATVVHWNADYTYETLKQGTNRLVCYDRSSDERRAAFDVQCTSIANLDRVAQSRRFRVEGGDRQGERALLAAAEADGTRVLPEYGSLWIAMRGDDRESAGTHTTIAVPGATTATTGFPESGEAGGAYIMGAGTSTAHIMTPGS